MHNGMDIAQNTYTELVKYMVLRKIKLIVKVCIKQILPEDEGRELIG